MYVHFAGCVNVNAINVKTAITPLLFGNQASIPAKHCLESIVPRVREIKASAVLDAHGVFDAVEDCTRVASVNGAVISPEAAGVQFRT